MATLLFWNMTNLLILACHFYFWTHLGKLFYTNYFLYFYRRVIFMPSQKHKVVFYTIFCHDVKLTHILPLTSVFLASWLFLFVCIMANLHFFFPPWRNLHIFSISVCFKDLWHFFSYLQYGKIAFYGTMVNLVYRSWQLWSMHHENFSVFTMDFF